MSLHGERRLTLLYLIMLWNNFPCHPLGELLKEQHRYLPLERSQPKAGPTVGPERYLLVAGSWVRPRFLGRAEVTKVENSLLGFFNILIAVQAY